MYIYNKSRSAGLSVVYLTRKEGDRVRGGIVATYVYNL